MTAERIPVGFLRHNFLHRSESWLYSSMQGLEEGGRYHVRVFALRRYLAERFPWTDVTVLGNGAAQAWYWLTRRAPAFTRWARSVRLIHAHLGPTGPFAMAGALAAGVPFVVSYYGHDVVMFRTRERFEPWAWWYTLLRRRVFARAARIVVLSEHMRRALVAQGCPAEKVDVVRLGVDLARFAGGATRAVRRADRPLRVLMVGREVDKKGFDDGLAACRAAIDGGVACDVTLLGTGGPLAGYLRLKARSLGVGVRWLEPSHPVPAAMADADVLLAPSRTAADGDEEGTPTVIVEAGAAGLPVVATRHAGIPEQVDDGRTGLLAGERDIWGLAEALVAMARDPARAHAMGAAARDRMTRDYSLAAHRTRLHAVYDAVLGEAA